LKSNNETRYQKSVISTKESTQQAFFALLGFVMKASADAD
jgi:hypothetical protein